MCLSPLSPLSLEESSVCNSSLGFVFSVPCLPSVNASGLKIRSAQSPNLELTLENVARKSGTH